MSLTLKKFTVVLAMAVLAVNSVVPSFVLAAEEVPAPVVETPTEEVITPEVPPVEEPASEEPAPKVLIAIPAPQLEITDLCSYEPSVYKTWRIHNTTASEITFSWEIVGTQQSGGFTIAPNGYITFDTVTEGDNQLEVYIGESLIASAYNEGGTCNDNDNEVAPCNTEIVQNGSFETPTITNPQGWDAFESGANNIAWKANWINNAPQVGKPVVANLELQNFLTAQNGDQFTELDSDWDGIPSANLDDASVKISQYLATKIGSTYGVSYYTSPLPGTDATQNKVEFSWDGNVIDTTSEDGTLNADNMWTLHTFNLVATDTTTRIDFADAGISNTFGSLLDNVSVKEKCASNVHGIVYFDANTNNTQDEGEDPIEGMTIQLIRASQDGEDEDADLDEELVATDVSDAVGNYSFLAERGCYIVREVPAGYTQTEPAVTGHEYYINVLDADCNFTPVEEEVIGFFFKTAHAADASTVFVAYTGQNLPFGNFDRNGGGNNGGGGSSSGSRPNDEPDRPGQVLGDSTNTPSGEVAGATTLPRTGTPTWALLFIAVLAVPAFYSRKLAVKKQ